MSRALVDLSGTPSKVSRITPWGTFDRRSRRERWSACFFKVRIFSGDATNGTPLNRLQGESQQRLDEWDSGSESRTKCRVQSILTKQCVPSTTRILCKGRDVLVRQKSREKERRLIHEPISFASRIETALITNLPALTAAVEVRVKLRSPGVIKVYELWSHFGGARGQGVPGGNVESKDERSKADLYLVPGKGENKYPGDHMFEGGLGELTRINLLGRGTHAVMSARNRAWTERALVLIVRLVITKKHERRCGFGKNRKSD